MDFFANLNGHTLISFLKRANLYPFFRKIDATSGGRVHHDGRELIMMGSNNYLGLTHERKVMNAAIAAIGEWGTGCTGSRFLNGNLAIHESLESELSEFFEYDDALVFASGFMANLGALSCIVGKGDYIFSDDENHACIIEGCKQSGAEILIFKHNDMTDLELKLKTVPETAKKLIVTDAVFSMDGSVAKFGEIHRLARIYGAKTYVDEAHSVGVIGKNGRGISELCGVKADIMMGTFSKSLASQGGFICASHEVIDWIRLKGRTFMFSAALSPANVAAAIASLRILREEPQRVQILRKNALYLRNALSEMGLPVAASDSSIISIPIGDEVKTLSLSKDFQSAGVFITPVVFPAVPRNQGSVRCSVMATHSIEDLQLVVKTFERYKDLILAPSAETSLAFHDFLKNNKVEMSLNKHTQQEMR